MDDSKNPTCPVLCKVLDPQESHIFDRERYIFDPILSYSNLYRFGNYLFEEYMSGYDEFNICESNLAKSIVP